MAVIGMLAIEPQSCIGAAPLSIGHDCAATADEKPLAAKAIIVSMVNQVCRILP